MAYTSVSVLIPAYKPDERLNQLVDELKDVGFMDIIAVDDGGGAQYAPIFARLKEQGVTVLTHEVNKGKGAALKTGLRYIIETGSRGVITADADGQHAPSDIIKIADALVENPDSLVLGVRDKKQMPPRSRVGNTLTCYVFGLMTGLWITDTQTGLRGLPAACLESFSQLEGDRYEYEQNMLLDVRHRRVPVKEVGIQTIYLDNNASSHFNALRDGLRIYGLLFRQIGAFVGSSVISAVGDYVLFVLIGLICPEPLLVSVVGARVCSSLVNYLINRTFVFKAQRKFGSLVRYYALVVGIMLASYVGILALTQLYVPRFIAKLIVDALLFVVSYNIQQKLGVSNSKNEEPA